ncbi:hypothetical protein TWF281_009784 [Arthrobotrys megalospora]
MSTTSPSKSSIWILPTELHVQILSHLSIEGQIFAAKCCKLWRDIIVNDHAFRKARYSSNKDPDLTPTHNILSEDRLFGFIYEDGQVESFRCYNLGSINSNKQIKNREWQWEPMVGTGYQPERCKKFFESCGGERLKEMEIATWADISNSPFLDEPVFLNSDKPVGSDDEIIPVDRKSSAEGENDEPWDPTSAVDSFTELKDAGKEELLATVAVQERSAQWTPAEVMLELPSNPTIKELVQIYLVKTKLLELLKDWKIDPSKKREVLFWLDREPAGYWRDEGHWRMVGILFNRRERVRITSKQELHMKIHGGRNRKASKE